MPKESQLVRRKMLREIAPEIEARTGQSRAPCAPGGARKQRLNELLSDIVSGAGVTELAMACTRLSSTEFSGMVLDLSNLVHRQLHSPLEFVAIGAG